MNKYECILFDADNTLFSFNAEPGFKAVMQQLGLDDTDSALADYKALNQSLWRDYEQGDITLQQLQVKRFMPWASNNSDKAARLNHDFLINVAHCSKPLPGAQYLLRKLKQRADIKLGLVSNGFSVLHKHRLKKTGFADYFDQIIISEEVGVAKPDALIFEQATNQLNAHRDNRTLMVGDNVNADIMGANNFGLDTCWINAHDKQAPRHIQPTHTVANLDQLTSLLLPISADIQRRPSA